MGTENNGNGGEGREGKRKRKKEKEGNGRRFYLISIIIVCSGTKR